MNLPKNLKSIFEAKSIAVIGASNREGSVGHSIFYNLIHNGYKGILYPVNPKNPSVLGVKTYPSILDVPDEVECAVLIVPADTTAKVIEQCGQKKVQGVVIVSAGFKEVGGDGILYEEQVKKTAKHYNMAMVGPNCLGVINTDPTFSINASFARTMPRAGNIAFLSQSGALCTAVLDYAKGNNIGFSKFISIGNKADVNELDLIRYLANDPQTKVILMYIEDLVNGREFIEAARSVTIETKNKKPILAIKSGRTAAGAAAASSHTGSLAGSDNVYDAIFIQSGVLRVESVEELFALATAFSQQPLPAGNRVAIVTNAGGPGIMTVDAAVRAGLEIVKFEPETIQKLKKKPCPPPPTFTTPWM
jgi:acetyltransferase